MADQIIPKNQNMKAVCYPALKSYILFTFLLLISASLFSQSTGIINRTATSVAGRSVLDPNGDGYTSATTTGFYGNDVSHSELTFRSVPSYSIEPYGDLRRGPSHLYSDFVPDSNGVGNYIFFDGTNMIFRWRMGSVMTGSKGYSILLDTDSRIGSTGPAADPNFQPETTGTNGNPGFEIEIVLETNFRIAIYNVDGSSSPVLIKQYLNWQDMSQVSIAGTFDNGDPDFFIDFYIPFSDLAAAPFNLTTSTPLRMGATTVMSPGPAIGGPKSDIYGMNDNNYKTTGTQYEIFISNQPPFTIGGLPTSGFGPRCTKAPKVNSPIGSGTVNITGTWAAEDLPGSATTAAISVYINGVLSTTLPGISTGSTWTLNNITLNNGDIITARAQGLNETQCHISNAVKALGCNTSNIPSSTGLAITCISNRGIEGTYPASQFVRVYMINPTTFATTLVAGPAAASPTFGYSGSNFFYNGTNYNGSQIPSACSGGSPDMATGIFYVTTSASLTGCESEPVFSCQGTTGTTATPVISQASLFTSSTVISGTATAGATVFLWINGQLSGTTTAAGGNYSFNGLTLSLNDDIKVRALTTGTCISTAAIRTVTCFTATPLINADKNGQVSAGAAITGTSSEAAGTTITVYTSANALVSTTTVSASRTWSTAPYVAVAGTGYYASAQSSGCGISTSSATFQAAGNTTGRCGTITSPVLAADGSVSGTLTGSAAGTTVNLYLDGEKIGTTTTSGTSWSIPSSSFTFPLYANGSLTIGIAETSRQEQTCPALVTVSCTTGPPAPIISPSASVLTAGQQQTYTISNAVPGAFYGIADAITGQSLGDGVWATGSTVTLTTKSFSAGSYSVAIKGTTLSGLSLCSSPASAASLTVTGTLPLTLVAFYGSYAESRVRLNWSTQSETGVDRFEIERSENGYNFSTIGEVNAANITGINNYAFTDVHPRPVNYYRLRIIDIDGSVQFSNVIRINTVNNLKISVSPNPFTSAVKIEGLIPGVYTVALCDMAGRKVSSGKVTFSTSTSIAFPAISKGVYQLNISNSTGIVYRTRLVKNH